MKITIWSDFICPFCIIGQSHLDRALDSFENKESVDIEYKSFLLMPEAKYIPGKSYAETFSESKGMPIEQANVMLNQVANMAKNSGVDINYDTAKLTSTVDAHRIFQYAKEQGKGTEFFKRFYAAHFSEGEIISDFDVIARLSEEVGIDGAKVRTILDDKKEYMDKVERDIAEARAVGVQGVPYFVFDNKYAVSGAQPVDAFSQVLNKVWNEKQAD